ncbi:hypothetical protein [Pseudomonas sp. zfem002]|uniref:hypothetical protein n=1 Tax=Pseudomonas sp. zfem002 TaxID=3078197 RepID=UPI00292827B5|nr:hypothetical protein [Pseudomonas sp. zfem002]MDU9389144.1 hypothetical protein [Pseudomonas sp. zfem002]
MNIQGVVFALSLLLVALLARAASDVPSPDQVEAERLSPGQHLLRELTARYEATPARCADGDAAYKCSGVMLRGTRQNLPEGQYAWEPYPRGRTLDTSFTFVRADIRISRLAWHYSNGFIIDPPQELSVNCFFPIDAVSDERLDNGCGANRSHRYTYSLCETLLADATAMDRDSEEYRWTTDQLAELWLEWDRHFAGDLRRRCSYALNDAHATQRFEIALAVAAKASRLTDKPNDMKVQTWSPGYDPRLPIRAFFYLNDQGRPFAERDREQFERVTGMHLPIIKVLIAGEGERNFVFEFLE